MRTVRAYAVPGMLVAIPVLLALFGSVFASDDSTKDVAFTLGGGHWFGTDYVGRDVWNEVLLGGGPLVLVAVTATACHLPARRAARAWSRA